MSNPQPRVLKSLDAGVLLLTLNRPDRKNAFDETMWREARDALAEAQADDAVRTVVITGAGDAFSAGQDLGQMAARPDDEPPGFPGFIGRPFVRRAFFVSGSAALTGDLTLTRGIH